jgi:hypothetical protein
MQGLGPLASAALTAPRWRQLVHFRTAPQSWLNNALRAALRRASLRGDVSREWRAPFQMQASVSQGQLQWHLKTVAGWWEQVEPARTERGERMLARLASETRAAGAVPIFAMAPVHPQLAPQAARLLAAAVPAAARVARQQQAVFLNAHQLLSPDQFADALHPNRYGREVYSRHLGSELSESPRVAGR